MIRALAVLAILATVAHGQEDQTPRASTKVNREFFDLAAATGGDFYFWAPGEFAASNVKIPIHHEEVLLAYGSVESKRVFEIPVESGVRSLTVFAGAERKDLAVLVRPNGLVVNDAQSTQRMLIATVDKPDPGIWQLELDGGGLFCVTVHVQPAADGPSLDGFAVDDGTCKLEFSGAAREIEVAFVAKDGSPIGDASLKPGHCTVPKVPFRVVVTGVDANGKPFRRIERGLRDRR